MSLWWHCLTLFQYIYPLKSIQQQQQHCVVHLRICPRTCWKSGDATPTLPVASMHVSPMSEQADATGGHGIHQTSPEKSSQRNSARHRTGKQQSERSSCCCGASPLENSILWLRLTAKINQMCCISDALPPVLTGGASTMKQQAY